MDSHDKAHRKHRLGLQLEILRRHLAENERSWNDLGFNGIPNPVADSICRDISEKEAELAEDSN